MNQNRISRKLKTHHAFLLKKIEDCETVDGRLVMVGTIVQRVFGITEKGMKEILKLKEVEPFFKYRINEETAGVDSMLNVRQTGPIKVKDVGVNGTDEVVVLGIQSNMEARIPLKVEKFISAFPFEVYRATATIELRPIVDYMISDDPICPNVKCMIHSDLMLHKSDSRHSIAVQSTKDNDKLPFDVFAQKEESNSSDDDTPRKTIQKLLYRIDKTKTYGLFSPYPDIFYQHNTKKNCCQRFVVSFFIGNAGFQKLVAIVLPMILVTFLAILNVANDMMMDCGEEAEGECIEGEDVSNHLQVTSALTLAIVFVLPQIFNTDSYRDQFKLVTKETISIIVFFLSLVLASVPRRLSIRDSATTELVGVILMTLSTFLFPLYNSYIYLGIKRKIEAKALRSTMKSQFLLDRGDRLWKEDQGFGDFSTVGDILQEKTCRNSDKDIYVFDEQREKLWFNTFNPKAESK